MATRRSGYSVDRMPPSPAPSVREHVPSDYPDDGGDGAAVRSANHGQRLLRYREVACDTACKTSLHHPQWGPDDCARLAVFLYEFIVNGANVIGE